MLTFIRNNFLKSILSASLLLSVTSMAATTTDTTASSSANVQFSEDQVMQIQTIVQQYLMQNPEILIAISQELQKKEQLKQQQAANSAILKNSDQLFADKNSPVLGNANGAYTIVEFYDYQCGHCKNMSDTIQDIITNNTNIKIILKELPIFGGVSKIAAQASLAVYSIAPEKFLEFHKDLLTNEGPLSEEQIISYAKDLGISAKKLQTAMNSDAVSDELSDNFKLAEAIGINGTPGFIVANSDLSLKKFSFIPGATDTNGFNKVIASLNDTSSTKDNTKKTTNK